MTGTSVDAADAVKVDFAAGGCRLIAAAAAPIPAQLADALRHFAESAAIPTRALLQATNDLTRLCAQVARAVGTQDAVAIGCHGQTIAHRPQQGLNWQILNGALLAELADCDVICDFRSRDIAAGGEGAPLAPLFHSYYYARRRPCDVVNIGGISNITHLAAAASANSDDNISAYDIGPGMMLSDAWHQRHHNGRFDRDGKVAQSGNVSQPVLAKLLSHPFISRPPPKSCGREEFALRHFADALASLSAADGQATLLEFTARAIAGCIRAPKVFVGGGGARNPALIRRLQSLCPSAAITPAGGIPAAAKIPSTVASGGAGGKIAASLELDAQHIEAAAFAYLARCHITKTKINTAAITGGKPHIPGAHYPA